MSSLRSGPVHAVALPEQEAELARQSSDALQQFLHPDQAPLALRLEDLQSGQQIEARIPAVAVRVLADVLAKLAEGDPVTLIPLHSELSTQQAAELLGVSRPYFIKLLEQGQMPYRKVGEQRRVRYRDLLAYIERYQQEAHAALDEMAAEVQRLGLYE
ncbi:MAG: helix-turn-helix domain-containing protein [Armatimonadetes bacterium]|nr:helix-turn-helix domain-containing protein [Armatimonadota bacterium]